MRLNITGLENFFSVFFIFFLALHDPNCILINNLDNPLFGFSPIWIIQYLDNRVCWITGSVYAASLGVRRLVRQLL